MKVVESSLTAMRESKSETRKVRPGGRRDDREAMGEEEARWSRRR